MKLGSLFSGIGGLELGLERSIPNLHTVWQVEKDSYCQKILRKHWDVPIYDDVRTVGQHNLESIDILCAGFPCQSISTAGKMEGLSNENKSGLWWEVHRIIGELRPQPKLVILENVANILRVGGPDVVGSLAKIGYDCEWTIISAAQTGAPHVRNRWFAIAFPSTIGYYLRNERAFANTKSIENRNRRPSQTATQKVETRSDTRNLGEHPIGKSTERSTTNTNSQRIQEQPIWSESVGTERQSQCGSSQTPGSQQNYWKGFPTQSPLCRRDDGIPNRVDRLRALGNAVVPQCSEWVGQQIVKSGILESLCFQNN